MAIQSDTTQKNQYNVIIIGGGPAAVSAAIYLHRFDFKVIMLGEEYGGAISRTYLMENYPGFYDMSGYDLMEKFQKHYEYFGIPFEYETVIKIEKQENNFFTVETPALLSFCTVSASIPTP